MFNLKRVFYAILTIAFACNLSVMAASTTASTDFSFTIDEYMKIEPVTSPVLIANIVDRTGNLYAPLMTQFRVLSNSHETKTLYLKAEANVQGGRENAMFSQGGAVYIAFTNLRRVPTLGALNKCKYGSAPEESPGVVAYPITSVTGAKNRYNPGKAKYEVSVGQGTTYVTVNVGSNVLRTSFGANDPRGAYQAILSLTESDL